ncbi:MAG: multiubiquitin domain-containing protein [Bacteroidetes bacterium]|nr:multiubiquitin domain-containing protein [Bacteroidota bacterium]
MNKEEQKHGHDKPVLPLTINGKQFEWNFQYINGTEIRKLGNIPPEEDIFSPLKSRGR